MLDGTMIDKELLKNKIFEYASRQYDELDVGERITMEMSADRKSTRVGKECRSEEHTYELQ